MDSLVTTSPLHSLTEAEVSDFGDIFPAAIELVHRQGRVSIPLLQQQLAVGYCRAIRIADALERLGHTPPAVHPRRRARFQPVAA